MVSLGAVQGQIIAGRVVVGRAVQHQPGLAAVHRPQEADTGRAARRGCLTIWGRVQGSRVACACEDDRLFRAVVAAEYRDGTAVQAVGRAEARQGLPDGPANVLGQEVCRLEQATRGGTNIDGVAGRVARVNGHG